MCVCTCLTERGRLNNLLGRWQLLSMDHYPLRRRRGRRERKVKQGTEISMVKNDIKIHNVNSIYSFFLPVMS